ESAAHDLPDDDSDNAALPVKNEDGSNVVTVDFGRKK
ncbi:MAG: hypothetical protein RLZZ84_1936, partial [Pseudomonadota bacterium]